MTQQTTQLAMAIHCHQPVGNFSRVFQSITEESYRPFLETYQQFEAGSLSVHVSGPLLEWWTDNAPDIIDILGELVQQDRVEMLGGGFYEPVLPLIPRRDRRAQMTKLNDYIDSLFGTRPRGIWLTERVWQPDLVEDLTELGLEYVIVDDFHFRCAGWDIDALSGWYTTENAGDTIGVFPISKELRYRIPFYDVDDIQSYLEGSEARALTMADDGEKFGSWPDTQQWVYEDGWLERFLTAVDEGQIQMESLGSVMHNSPSSGSCYLPTASYREMMEWSQSATVRRRFQDWKSDRPDDAEQFGQGGLFQNFLVKYEESNRLHKYMLWLSGQIDPEQSNRAYDKLLQGQCNDAFWHGVFGGLFLPHLRSTLWNKLNQAHRQADLSTDGFQRTDFDADGNQEIIYGDPDQFLVVDPHSAGELVLWNLLPAARNVLDTLTRRWEPYLEEQTDEDEDVDGEVDTIHHRKTSVPEDWLSRWSEDQVPRAGFQPLISDDVKPDPESVSRQQPLSYIGRNQTPTDYEASDQQLSLQYDDELHTVSYQLLDRGLNWQGKLHESPENAWGCAVTVGFRSPDSADSAIQCQGEQFGPLDWLQETTRDVELVDRLAGYTIQFRTNREVQFVTHPVKTISRSEQDAERIYQGTALYWFTDRADINITVNWNTDE